MTPKVWYTSKTLWYNVLTVIVFVATMFFGYQQNAALIGQLQVILTNPFVITLVNMALRLVTKQPLTLSVPQLPNGTTIDTAPPATTNPNA